MSPTLPIDRRTFLRSAGTAALGVSLAGCSGLPLGSTGAAEDVALDPPENYEKRSDADLPYPIHGEELPEVSVPAPLHDREVSTREFVGDRHAMLTFVFARCSMTCPALTANLVQVQAESVAEGFADEMAFLPVTFDPEHDTAAELESYGEDRGVDREAGNWWFLRPEGDERARTVVTDAFGVAYEYIPKEDRDAENMAYVHTNLIVLANADGYVERAYTGQVPNPADVVDDVRTLRERW
ncbi:SCO family protein [Halorubrum salipaludis]|uniref:SCO family protein n=1 Tax=Halorubrum salipaludis TaxID=2032630 RepID=A0A2A2FDY9_9EURY|nr:MULTISPECIES: SCO family protein [Halorubrum]PAU82887.1 SCO family protein [Halorubrum salipaludis]